MSPHDRRRDTLETERPTMREKRLLGYAIGCALLLFCSGCGGDEAPPEREKIRSIGKTRDKSRAKPLENPSAARTRTTSITDTKNRKKVEHFRAQLKAVKNSDDRAEVLASIAEGGQAFKPRLDITYDCADSDAAGRNFTTTAVVDIHADDAAACDTIAKISMGICRIALSDDDVDDNITIRQFPIVKFP